MRTETFDLAIIGAGPAGLTAGREAAALGLDRIVVFEREDTAGGTVRHCGHVGFGMRDFHRCWRGPHYAEVLRERASGLDVRLSHAVTNLGEGGHLAVSTPAGPLEVRAERVLLATGIRETPRAARLVSGGRPFGILTTGALQRFIYLHERLPCRRPVVVGTGAIAFSTIVTLRHGGGMPAAIVGEEEGLETFAGAALGARVLFGVPVWTNVRIVAIEGASVVEGLTVERGDRRQTIACDGVVFTGQWVPEAALMRLHPAGVDQKTQGPSVDEELRTSDPHLFAAGNVRFAVRSSGPCALEGRRAARIICNELGVGRTRRAEA